MNQIIGSLFHRQEPAYFTSGLPMIIAQFMRVRSLLGVRGRGTLEILVEASHTGILVGMEWEEGANAINAWLGTNGFAELDPNGFHKAN